MATNSTLKPSPRLYQALDAGLILRTAAATAITSAGANFAAPDYESALIDIGPGVVDAKVCLHNIVAAVNADNIVHFAVVGVDSKDSDKAAVLAVLPLGPAATTGSNVAFALATGMKNVYISFCNALHGRVFDKVKIVVVVGGTAAGFSLDFEAFISRKA